MNPGLQRIHRLFAVIFGVVVIGAVLIGVIGGVRELIVASFHDSIVTLSGSLLAVVLFVPFFLAHWYAAKGAKLGKSYGRVISKVIAFLWIFGFPIGTILACYVFPKTNDALWNKPVIDTSKDSLHTVD